MVVGITVKPCHSTNGYERRKKLVYTRIRFWLVRKYSLVWYTAKKMLSFVDFI